MFLRVELFGIYLELGRMTSRSKDDSLPTDTQYPMAEQVERAGFRIIGDEHGWVEDVR